MFKKAVFYVFNKKSNNNFWPGISCGGGSRYPGWGILAPTQMYTDMTIKTSKTGRTVVKCSEKQFLCVINKKIQQQKKKIHFLAWYKGWGPRYPGRGILAPTLIYTVKTIKHHKLEDYCCPMFRKAVFICFQHFSPT